MQEEKTTADYIPQVDLDDMMTLGDAANLFGVKSKTIIWWLQAFDAANCIKSAGRRQMIRLGALVGALNGEKEVKGMIPVTEIPLMLSAAEASMRTGISGYTIRRWASEGRIRYVKSGCKMYIHFQSLIKYLENEKE